MLRNDFFWVFVFFSVVIACPLYLFNHNLDFLVGKLFEFLPWIRSVPSVDAIFLHSPKSEAYILAFIVSHILAIVIGIYLILIRRSKDIHVNDDVPYLGALSAGLVLFPGVYVFFFYTGLAVSHPHSEIIFTRMKMRFLQVDVYYLFMVALVSTINTYCLAAVIKLAQGRRSNNE